MEERPKPEDLKREPKTNYEVLGAIVGAVLGSAIGAMTGQFFVAMAVCVGLGWVLGIVLQQRKKDKTGAGR